ncbi:P2X purinoceptor 7-like [Saccostrea echinata]|uniref:P2X purinoceptor 7-like n=1 Tax=Saccostrea echinata TaxID=191078 RepID=UPI002A7EE4DF|nr:P2X purinoceptor 7-like [Saccostrea echinata]
MDNEYTDIDDIPGNINIQPYMFEPPPRPNVQESSEESDYGDEHDHGHRRLNTFWCECGSCQQMGTITECVCCVELPAINTSFRESSDLECITHHQTFIDNYLNVRVLEVSLHDYIQREGPLDDNEPIHEVYRHIACRRFVLWIWHRLGKGNRKVLPACVVSRIRHTFPFETYVGFQYPRPDS